LGADLALLGTLGWVGVGFGRAGRAGWVGRGVGRAGRAGWVGRGVAWMSQEVSKWFVSGL